MQCFSVSQPLRNNVNQLLSALKDFPVELSALINSLSARGVIAPHVHQWIRIYSLIPGLDYRESQIYPSMHFMNSNGWLGSWKNRNPNRWSHFIFHLCVAYRRGAFETILERIKRIPDDEWIMGSSKTSRRTLIDWNRALTEEWRPVQNLDSRVIEKIVHENIPPFLPIDVAMYANNLRKKNCFGIDPRHWNCLWESLPGMKRDSEKGTRNGRDRGFPLDFFGWHHWDATENWIHLIFYLCIAHDRGFFTLIMRQLDSREDDEWLLNEDIKNYSQWGDKLERMLEISRGYYQSW